MRIKKKFRVSKKKESASSCARRNADHRHINLNLCIDRKLYIKQQSFSSWNAQYNGEQWSLYIPGKPQIAQARKYAINYSRKCDAVSLNDRYMIHPSATLYLRNRQWLWWTWAWYFSTTFVSIESNRDNLISIAIEYHHNRNEKQTLSWVERFLNANACWFKLSVLSTRSSILSPRSNTRSS